MQRLFVLLYGQIAYAIFFGTFLYLIGFVGDLFVPRTVDAGGAHSPLLLAILINAGLISLFGIQHAIMARPGFKRWWTKFVPEPMERSTFVLTTCVVLGLLYWQWRPLPEVVWSTDNAIATALLGGVFWAGWGLVLVSTFLIDHFDLFGLRQTLSYAFGRTYKAPRFTENLVYNTVRHPLMLGFLLAFWATPHMTVGRLLFCAVYTIYILLALRVEERDLVTEHGQAYVDYQRRVPMLLPLPRKSAPRAASTAS